MASTYRRTASDASFARATLPMQHELSAAHRELARAKKANGAPVAVENFRDPYHLVAEPRAICRASEHGRKRNCAQNCWCVYGLGELKAGVWEEARFLDAALGSQNSIPFRTPDAASAGRLVPPTGLKNLGATCYMNVLLQSLFHNLLVRDAIFNINVDDDAPTSTAVAQDGSAVGVGPVIAALQAAFAHMQFNADGVYDLSPLAALLGIDRSYQQDPQEFNKLFLGRLESVGLPILSDRYAALAQLRLGTQKNCMTCTNCGAVAEAPMLFHDLDLNIEHSSSLEEALVQYLADEVLEGDNRYRCSSCLSLVDARRSTSIAESPVLLNIQLLRYVYDRTTFEKRRLKKPVTFPDTIEVPPGSGVMYKLVSVLYHLGHSAYGGHYVCDVLEWTDSNTAEQWWHCDDTRVTPTSDPASAVLIAAEEAARVAVVEEVNAAAAAAAAAAVAVSANDAEAEFDDAAVAAAMDADGDEWIPARSGKAKKATTGTGKRGIKGQSRGAAGTSFGSATPLSATVAKAPPPPQTTTSTIIATNGVDRVRDAYMFSYVQVSHYHAAKARERAVPSAALRSEVAAASAMVARKVAERAARRADLQQQAEMRRASYLSLQSSLVPTSADHGQKFHLIPTCVLKSWVLGEAMDALKPPQPSRKPVVPSSAEMPSEPAAAATAAAEPEKCCFDLTVDDGDDDNLTAVDSTAAAAAFDAADQNGLSDNETLHDDSDVEPKLEIEGAAAPAVFTVDEKVSKQLSSFRCPHGHLHPAYLPQFKVVTPDAFAAIMEPERVAPWAFTESNYRCDKCFESVLQQKQDAVKRVDLYDGIIKAVDEVARAPVENQFFVAKSWVSALKKELQTLKKIQAQDEKPFSSSASMMRAFVIADSTSVAAAATVAEVVVEAVDRTVNGSLFCTIHDGNCKGIKHLSLDYKKRSRLVSRSAWQTICAIFPDAESVSGDDQLSKTRLCPACVASESYRQEDAQLKGSERASVLLLPGLGPLSKNKRIYPSFIDATNIFVPSDEARATATKSRHPARFYLVDHLWLSLWREYIGNIHRDAPLPLFNNTLRCVHGNALISDSLRAIASGIDPNMLDVSSLLTRPISTGRGSEVPNAIRESLRELVLLTSGAASASNESAAAMQDQLPMSELVTQEQWESLLTLYSPHAAQGQSDFETADASGKRKRAHTDHEDVFAVTLTRGVSENAWQWSPPSCPECTRNMAEQRERNNCEFTDADLTVRLVSDELELLELTQPQNHPTVVHDDDAGASADDGFLDLSGGGGGGGAVAIAEVITQSGRVVRKRNATQAMLADASERDGDKSSGSSSNGAGLRRSNRGTTRGRRNMTKRVQVSSCDPIALVKLKIYEQFSSGSVDLVPGEQRLFDARGTELTLFNNRTLQDCGIRTDQTLYVLHMPTGATAAAIAAATANGTLPPNAHLYDAEGDGGDGGGGVLDYWNRVSGSRAAEQGFGGTFLSSSK